MAYQKDENELGVLWEKESARGTYYTGTIEIDGNKIAIVAFRNGNKKSEKAPDWRLYKSRPKQQETSGAVPF